MKYYVVFEPKENRGVYKSWDECKVVVCGCRSASYCSFKSLDLAEAALRSGSVLAARAAQAREKQCMWKTQVEMPCLVVDAACSGCPGPVEFRGVVLTDKALGVTQCEVFRCGPYASGTNNIGEFLGLVSGLRWLENTSLPYPVYTDSATAIKWVKTLGYCNSHQENVGRELAMAIRIAESWLQGPTAGKYIARIQKWDTRAWGEIPADYDRK
jgi:ribonuclease HI